MADTSQRGSISTELVLLFPLLIGGLWLALSLALHYLGGTTALTAAQRGARAAARADGSQAACRSAIAGLLTVADDVLSEVRIDCRRSEQAATATVSGVALSLVPGWHPTVSHTVRVALEEVT